VTLALEYERCVRTRSVASGCRACVDTCPAGAITLAGEKQAVAVDLDACSDCGLCLAACPTEAFSGVFDVATLEAPARLACGEGGVPCVGAVSAEDLVAFAQRSGRLEVVGRACAAGAKGHERAARAVAQAQGFLAALGLKAELSWRDEAPAVPASGAGAATASGAGAEGSRGPAAGSLLTGGAPAVGSGVPAPGAAAPATASPAADPAARPIPPRRQFLGLFVPRALPPQPVTRGRLAFPQRLDVKRLREVKPPPRRARMLAALPASAAPKVKALAAADLSFTSAKQVDAGTCTGCQACVTACPTGALTSSRLKEQLRFDASRCVRCGLCHDVCEPHAITLAPAVPLAEFLDFAPKTLVTLKMTQCGECGAPFKDDGREAVLCDRCRDQEAEARELSGAR
jgi:ferredoxin